MEESGEDLSDLLLAGVGRDCTGRDLSRGEVPDESLQLGETGVVGVADPVVAAALAHGDQPVLTGGLQAGHFCLGEVHRARLDLTHLELARLAGQVFEERLAERLGLAGVEPGGRAGLSRDTAGQDGATQLVSQTGLSHVNLPLPQ